MILNFIVIGIMQNHTQNYTQNHTIIKYQQSISMLQLVQQIQHSQKHLWSVSWHPSGDLFAVVGSDKKLTIFKKQNHQYLKSQTIDDDHTKSIRSVAFSATGSMMAVGSFDSYISVYHIVDGVYELLSRLEGHESEVKCVSWSPNEKHLASASRDKNVWIWEYQVTHCQFVCISVLEGHTQDVKWVTWLNNHKLASASYDDSIIIWEKQDDDYVKKQVITQNSSIVWCLQSIGQEYIFAVSEDKSLKVFQYKEDVDMYQMVVNLQGLHSRPIYSCSLNKQKNILVTTGGDNTITILDVAKIKEHQIQNRYQLKNAHKSDINCVKFHPFENLVLSCGDDKTIKLWKLNL